MLPQPCPTPSLRKLQPSVESLETAFSPARKTHGLSAGMAEASPGRSSGVPNTLLARLLTPKRQCSESRAVAFKHEIRRPVHHPGLVPLPGSSCKDPERVVQPAKQTHTAEPPPCAQPPPPVPPPVTRPPGRQLEDRSNKGALSTQDLSPSSGGAERCSCTVFPAVQEFVGILRAAPTALVAALEQTASTSAGAVPSALASCKLGACDAVLIDWRRRPAGEGSLLQLASHVAGCVLVLSGAAASGFGGAPANVCVVAACAPCCAAKLPTALQGLRGKPVKAGADGMARSDMQALIQSMEA